MYHGVRTVLLLLLLHVCRTGMEQSAGPYLLLHLSPTFFPARPSRSAAVVWFRLL